MIALKKLVHDKSKRTFDYYSQSKVQLILIMIWPKAKTRRTSAF